MTSREVAKAMAAIFGQTILNSRNNSTKPTKDGSGLRNRRHFGKLFGHVPVKCSCGRLAAKILDRHHRRIAIEQVVLVLGPATTSMARRR